MPGVLPDQALQFQPYSLKLRQLQVLLLKHSGISCGAKSDVPRGACSWRQKAGGGGGLLSLLELSVNLGNLYKRAGPQAFQFRLKVLVDISRVLVTCAACGDSEVAGLCRVLLQVDVIIL